MCGRIVVDAERLEAFLRTGALDGGPHPLSQWFAGPQALPASSWNIAPTQQLPVAYTDTATGARRSTHAHWSLVPRNAPSLTLKYPTFNARSETAATKPTFRRAVREGRCIIPVTGFYEWTGAARARTPHFIGGPEPVLALAGLLEWWPRPPGENGGGAPVATATVLTTASRGMMADLHDRMPVFVSGGDLEEWLNPRTPGDASLLADFAQRAETISTQLRTHPVAPLRGDGPQLIAPLTTEAVASRIGAGDTPHAAPPPTLW